MEVKKIKCKICQMEYMEGAVCPRCPIDIRVEYYTDKDKNDNVIRNGHRTFYRYINGTTKINVSNGNTTIMYPDINIRD